MYLQYIYWQPNIVSQICNSSYMKRLKFFFLDQSYTNLTKTNQITFACSDLYTLISGFLLTPTLQLQCKTKESIMRVVMHPKMKHIKQNYDYFPTGYRVAKCFIILIPQQFVITYIFYSLKNTSCFYQITDMFHNILQ